MKRLPCTLLLLALVALALPATGQDEAATDGEIDISRRVPITFYLKGGPSPDQDMVFSMIEEEIAETINVDLDFNWLPWSDYSQKTQVLFAAGDPFEIAMDNSWAALWTNVGKGNYMDVSGLLPEYAPNYWASMEEALDRTRFNGGIWGIPNKRPVVPPGRETLYYRGDLADAYGITEEIRTMDQMEEFFARVKASEPDLIPVDRVASDYLVPKLFRAVVVDSGLRVYYRLDDPNMILMAWEDIPGMAEYADRIAGWQESGWLPPDAQAQSQVGGVSDGKVAASWHGAWTYQRDWTKALQEQLGIDGYIAAGALYPDVPVYYGDIWGSTKVMNASADQPERTLMFIDWIHTSQENYDLFTYGIEGTHWEEMETGQWRSLGDPNPYSWWSSAWYFEDADYTRLGESQDPEFKALTDSVNYANAQVRPHDGMVWDYSQLKTEIANRSAIYAEYGAPIFELGFGGAEALEEYRVRQDEAGTDAIVSEMQRQLDEWIAARE